jgi:hypothetical protein
MIEDMFWGFLAEFQVTLLKVSNLLPDDDARATLIIRLISRKSYPDQQVLNRIQKFIKKHPRSRSLVPVIRSLEKHRNRLLPPVEEMMNQLG